MFNILFIHRLYVNSNNEKKMWTAMANSSFDIKKANNYTKNLTSYKGFCKNIHWVHLKSKVKQINIWDQENLSD